jgi:hypothetical protein
VYCREAPIAPRDRCAYDPTVTQTADVPTSTDGFLAVLAKVFLASLVVNLPMLGLLLVPQLVRSRAGSERLLLIGSTLYIALVAVALTIAPRVSAWAAPRADVWTASTAGGASRGILRNRAQEFWPRVGEWFLLFLLAQAAGLCVAWLLPYVADNPEFGGPGEPRWIIFYGNYLIHAVTIYVLSCLSFAWFGARLRQLAVTG